MWREELIPRKSSAIILTRISSNLSELVIRSPWDGRATSRWCGKELSLSGGRVDDSPAVVAKVEFHSGVVRPGFCRDFVETKLVTTIRQRGLHNLAPRNGTRTFATTRRAYRPTRRLIEESSCTAPPACGSAVPRAAYYSSLRY